MTKNAAKETENKENTYLTDDTSDLDYDDDDNHSLFLPGIKGTLKKDLSTIGLSENELSSMAAENSVSQFDKENNNKVVVSDSVDIDDLSLKQSVQLYLTLEGLSKSTDATSEYDSVISPMELQHKASELLEQFEGKELSDADKERFRKSLLEHQQKTNFDITDKAVHDLISQTIECEVKNKEIATQYFLAFLRLCRMINSHAAYLNVGEVVADEADEADEAIASIIKQDVDHNKEATPSKTNPLFVESVVHQDIQDNTILQPDFDFSPSDIVFTKAYKAKLLQNLHGDSNIGSILELNTKGLLLKFKPNGHNKHRKSADIIDTGNSLCKLKTDKSDPVESAEEMINILKAKGWNKITIQSTDNKEFEKKLISLAQKSNIAVRVIKSGAEKTSNLKRENAARPESLAPESESCEGKFTPQASFPK